MFEYLFGDVNPSVLFASAVAWCVVCIGIYVSFCRKIKFSLFGFCVLAFPVFVLCNLWATDAESTHKLALSMLLPLLLANGFFGVLFFSYIHPKLLAWALKLQRNDVAVCAFRIKRDGTFLAKNIVLLLAPLFITVALACLTYYIGPKFGFVGAWGSLIASVVLWFWLLSRVANGGRAFVYALTCSLMCLTVVFTFDLFFVPLVYFNGEDYIGFNIILLPFIYIASFLLAFGCFSVNAKRIRLLAQGTPSS